MSEEAIGDVRLTIHELRHELYRLECLVRRRTWQAILGFVATFVVILLVMVGVARPGWMLTRADSRRSIQRLEVVDESGVPAIVLSGSQRSLQLVDEKGTIRAELRMRDEKAGLWLSERAGRDMAAVWVEGYGDGHFRLYDADGRAQIVISTNAVDGATSRGIIVASDGQEAAIHLGVEHGAVVAAGMSPWTTVQPTSHGLASEHAHVR